MEPMESLFRVRNIRFFLILPASRKVKLAAKIAQISPQHATRLLALWLRAGLIVRTSATEWKYKYTDKGDKIVVALVSARISW
jgi:hypothetical protein